LPIIPNIIDGNLYFYRFKKKIRWYFFENSENLSVCAFYNKEKDMIFNTMNFGDVYKKYSNLHSKIYTEISSGRLIRIYRNLHSDSLNEDV